MTRPKVNTPISDEEAEAWVKRMVISVEDVGMLADEEAWAEYVSSKLLTQQGYEPSEAQFERLGYARDFIAPQLSYGTRFPFAAQPWRAQYFDTRTGRIMSQVTAQERINFWKTGEL